MIPDTSILENNNEKDEEIEDLLSGYVEEDDHVFVVLDDDPTGVQCVHDINVYTDISHESIRDGFDHKLFFILTNSRAMSEDQTKNYHEKLIETVSEVSKETGKKYLYISRGDSTLRGHYPLEPDILCAGLVKDYGKVDGEILIPYFKEGGRFTIDDVHYVKYEDRLIPCAETEFAKDKTFGYSSSDLKGYIEEKTDGKIAKEDVLSICLNDLKNRRSEKICDLLCQAHDRKRIIVNAVCDDDIRVFCIALYQAMKKGKIFSFRTAASFVKCVGGVSDKDLLSHEELISGEQKNGGIIVIGSHTDKTTRQMEMLRRIEGLEFIEFKCSKILESKEEWEREIRRCVSLEEELISKGKSVVIYTERVLLSFESDSKEEALERSVRISEGVYTLIKDLKVRPSFVVAKGGITSADVGVKGLGIRKALVLGQIEPGVPVWKADSESKFPDIPYVIFPGNVGDDDTLHNAVKKLLSC